MCSCRRESSLAVILFSAASSSLQLSCVFHPPQGGAAPSGNALRDRREGRCAAGPLVGTVTTLFFREGLRDRVVTPRDLGAVRLCARSPAIADQDGTSSATRACGIARQRAAICAPHDEACGSPMIAGSTMISVLLRRPFGDGAARRCRGRTGFTDRAFGRRPRRGPDFQSCHLVKRPYTASCV